MTALSELAVRNGLLLVEDAAQAHGARFEGAPIGSLGDIAGFSFYPSKNLGALGDGGAVCTNDDELAARVRRLRNLGQHRKGEHLDVGFNERLDGLQAAFLRIKLRDLDAKNAARRKWAALYRELLPDDVVTLGEDPRGEPVYHLFPVRVSDRASVQAALQDAGVQTGIHYHPAVHEQPPIADLASRNGGFPVAKRWSEEVLSLPMFPELTPAEVQRVAEVLADAVDLY
jgi:dTDP-4-amino-4,6-dideoxygalactose transaminase